MGTSILITIKKMVGISPEQTPFDTEIIVHINTALMRLCQLGVGPTKPASITSEAETWIDIFGDTSDFEAVKTYIYLKVRTLFDPPSSSSVLEAMNRQISELEWCLNVQTDIGKEE